MCENARIGIFWRAPYRGGFVLVADAIPLSAAELYGDCLTYPRGHTVPKLELIRESVAWLDQYLGPVE